MDHLTAYQKVQLARHPQRPYFLDYVEHLCPDFTEIHGDRKFGDDAAIVGGFGMFRNLVVCLIGHQKGRDTKQRQYRNFGMANPEGYRKAMRLMKLAEKFDKPVVTLIDTPGAYPGLEAEERGQGDACDCPELWSVVHFARLDQSSGRIGTVALKIRGLPSTAWTISTSAFVKGRISFSISASR